ncbi:MAG: hypothetical protein KF858_01295 [Candidatus Sumerlaeia bacterium]|nr:hypothetical protein [Candidatus Sumerlaeia bacterium]
MILLSLLATSCRGHGQRVVIQNQLREEVLVTWTDADQEWQWSIEVPASCAVRGVAPGRAHATAPRAAVDQQWMQPGARITWTARPSGRTDTFWLFSGETHDPTLRQDSDCPRGAWWTGKDAFFFVIQPHSWVWVFEHRRPRDVCARLESLSTGEFFHLDVEGRVCQSNRCRHR